MLVRAAVMRRPNRGDVAAALGELLSTDILPRMRAVEPLAMQPPNAFRQQHCYTRDVTKVLERHGEALRVLYDFYAHGTGGGANAFKDKSLLGMDEWMSLLHDFDLLDTQLTERDATRCFVYARLRAIKESTTKGRAKLLQLSFEDSLEAIVRLATFKALPTDADVRGEYVAPPRRSHGKRRSHDKSMEPSPAPTATTAAALADPTESADDAGAGSRSLDTLIEAEEEEEEATDTDAGAAPAPAAGSSAPAAAQRLMIDGHTWAAKCKKHRAADGGELMLKLQAEGTQTWAAFLEMRRPASPGLPQLQPTARAVDCLCCFLVRTVHSVIPDDIAASDRTELRLTPRHVKRFSNAGAKRSRPTAKMTDSGF